MLSRKAIGSIVAIALLIVVSVVAVISFQGWFQTYSSEVYVKAETDSSGTSNTNIETLIGDQLYFKNTLGENISIKQIKLGKRECNISLNISPGVQNISLGTCVDNLTLDSNIGDITIITDKEIYTKKHLFKDISINFQGGSLQSAIGNYFGDGSDGNIIVNSSGVYQDLGGGYSLHPNTTGTQWNSILDGDMVVINAQDFTVESGVTFTTTNRCRGLMIYASGDVVVNGTISMTARGAHANPADSSATVNTPVGPSDLNSVPTEGLVIRRIKSNWSDITGSIISNANAVSIDDFNGTHNSSDLFYGTGNSAVLSEANQPNVTDGLVIKIPIAGGSGGIGGCDCNNHNTGGVGNTILFGFGGGGGGNAYATGAANGWPIAGSGGSGTSFSGGTGGGGDTGDQCCGQPIGEAGSNYGGPGGTGASSCGGGSGNPGENGGETGTSGLIIINSNNLEISSSGSIISEGNDGGSGPRGGGASGGGVIFLLYSNNLSQLGSISVAGGIGGAGSGGNLNYKGGDGGEGSIIGPIKIDP